VSVQDSSPALGLFAIWTNLTGVEMSTTLTIDEFLNQDAESRSAITQKHAESVRSLINNNPNITNEVFSALVKKANISSLSELRDVFALRNEVSNFISNPGSLDVSSVVEEVSQEQPGFSGVVEEPEVVAPTPVQEVVSAAVVEETPAVEEVSSLPEGFGALGTPQATVAPTRASGRSPVLRRSRLEPTPVVIEAETVETPTITEQLVEEVVNEVPFPQEAATDVTASPLGVSDVNLLIRKLTDRIKTLTAALESAHAENSRLKAEINAAKMSVSVSPDVLTELKSLGIDI
jgi:hypothetical protein